MLDAKSWEKGVMPNMGPRFGIFQDGFDIYPSYKGDKNLDTNFYPSQPLISLDEWQNLIDYYTATSPDSLLKQDRKQPIQSGLSLFSVHSPKFSYSSPAVSFSKINSADSLYPLIISDASKKITYFCNKQLTVKDSVNTSGPIVDIDFTDNQMLVCNIGVLNPNNGKSGHGNPINIDSKGIMWEDSIPLFDSLRRPVQIRSADLNNDGKNDYIVCEFGNLTGALSWMENLGNNKFTRHELRSLPGAIKAYVYDYNHDGALDIWVLFAQGEEGIFILTNDGHGKFESRQVLHFPSVYGSSYFEMADFNKDGHPDIVYTCGDNADFSPILKPYHGVYIFINDGKNNFEQKYFYPINGCYKAMARDFDGDGDLDIASIAFFPDFKHQPEEGFVYLEQQKSLDFKAYTLPECKTGRWLTMDAGDLDGDGKIDLLLGNFSIKPSAMPSEIDWKRGPAFLFLRNESK